MADLVRVVATLGQVVAGVHGVLHRQYARAIHVRSWAPVMPPVERPTFPAEPRNHLLSCTDATHDDEAAHGRGVGGELSLCP